MQANYSNGNDEMRKMGLTTTLAAVLAGLSLTSSACGDGPTAPLAEADTRIFFIGNSLTARNDLPGAVASIAAYLGYDVATGSRTLPNYSLEDHYWNGAQGAIREVAPDYVIMQQGPSSLEDNQVHLAVWADTLSTTAREVGAVPALYMVWPDLDRLGAFPAVLEAYRNAARQVGGIFLPAGEALKELHLNHPEITPYSPDRFHPNETGTVLAAMVIVATLFDADVTQLPAIIPAGGGGGRRIELFPEEILVLPGLAQQVADAFQSSPATLR